MRGEKDRRLVARDVAHERLQHLLGDGGIEARGRLVEHEQLRAAAQCEQQRKLGARAARQRFHFHPRRQLEDTHVALLEIAPPFREERGGEADDLLHRHEVVQLLVLADEAGAPPDLDARGRRIGREAEHTGGAAARPRHPQQHLDGRRLAGAVAPEEAVDGSARHLEVEAAHRLHRPVALLQAGDVDDEPISHADLLCA